MVVTMLEAVSRAGSDRPSTSMRCSDTLLSLHQALVYGAGSAGSPSGKVPSTQPARSCT